MSLDRVVPYDSINLEIAANTEFISVAAYSINRLDIVAQNKRGTIGIWGMEVWHIL